MTSCSHSGKDDDLPQWESESSVCMYISGYMRPCCFASLVWRTLRGLPPSASRGLVKLGFSGYSGRHPHHGLVPGEEREAGGRRREGGRREAEAHRVESSPREDGGEPRKEGEEFCRPTEDRRTRNGPPPDGAQGGGVP